MPFHTDRYLGHVATRQAGLMFSMLTKPIKWIVQLSVFIVLVLAVLEFVKVHPHPLQYGRAVLVKGLYWVQHGIGFLIKELK